METLTLLISLAGVAAIGMMSPGPDFIVITHASIAAGRGYATVVVLGVVLGSAVWAGAAIFGVGTLLTLFPAFFISFKIVGGGYLIWLGIKMLRGARNPLSIDTCKTQKNILQGLSRGFSTTAANPKAAIYYTSAITTLIPEDATIGMLLLMELTVVTVAAVWYLCVALLLSKPEITKLYKQFKLYLESLFGSLIIVLGAKQFL